MGDAESFIGNFFCDVIIDCVVVEFLDVAAIIADKILRIRVDAMRLDARHVGIQTFDAVHKTLRHKKIQRAINGHGLGALHFFDDVVGLERWFALDEGFEYVAAGRGEAFTLLQKRFFHPFKCAYCFFLHEVHYVIL